MVSRENRVLIACIGLALALTYSASVVTDLPDPALIAILLGVGTVAPLLVTDYLDRRGEDADGT